jgi:hypothetical protein
MQTICAIPGEFSEVMTMVPCTYKSSFFFCLWRVRCWYLESGFSF